MEIFGQDKEIDIDAIKSIMRKHIILGINKDMSSYIGLTYFDIYTEIITWVNTFYDALDLLEKLNQGEDVEITNFILIPELFRTYYTGTIEEAKRNYLEDKCKHSAEKFISFYPIFIERGEWSEDWIPKKNTIV